MKLRIAFFTPEYITENNFDGGLANYLYRVNKGLQQRNHEVEVFVVSNKNETMEKDGIIIHRVVPEAGWYSFTSRFFGKKVSGFRWLLLESYSLNKRFIKRHRENPFDIAQVPSYRASGIFLVLKNKLPVVTRISSYRKLCDEAYGRKINFDVRLQEWLEEIEVKRSFKTYAPSRFMANILFKELNKQIDEIKPSFFIEIGQYKNEIYNRELKDKQYVLFFGTIGKLKGVFVFMEALKKILREDLTISIVFIGKDTPYENRVTCMEKVKKELNVYKDRIYHFSSLHHEELYTILMNSKIVVLPSLVDNIPNTCLEAMAHGCIVVASDGASLDELIKDGESGLLFKLGDPDSLAQKILSALNLSGEDRGKMSANAKKAVGALAPEIILKKLEDYYISTIKEWTNK